MKRVKYFPWDARKKRESGTIRVSVGNELQWDLKTSALPGHSRTFSVRKGSSSLTSSTQSGIFPSTSLTRPIECLWIELATFYCLLALALMGTFIGLWQSFPLTNVKVLFPASRFSWPSWKHATMAPNSLSLSTLSIGVARRSEDSFCSRSEACWAPLFPSQSLRSEPWWRTNYNRKGNFSRLLVKFNHQCFFAAMKLVGGKSGNSWKY